MVRRGGKLRSRLLGSGQPTSEEMVDALESRLEETEEVAFQLASKGGITYEKGDKTVERGGGDGGTVLAVTDRKLVFVIDTSSGIETADIPYTDLKDVSVDSGLLRTTVSVTVWGRGTFRFKPSSGDDSTEAVEFATDASEAWQWTVAALQDARQHISTIEGYITDGDMEAAHDARESAIENLETARTRIDTSDSRFKPSLKERLEQTRTELASTWARARFKRGKELKEAAPVAPEDHDYAGAYETFRRAREHLEQAQTIAIEQGLDIMTDIQVALEELRDRQAKLEARPLELAEQARKTAQESDTPERSLAAWEEALARYRDALESGWGTNADFDGETDALRVQIEWVVGNIIDERCALANEFEAQGDQYSTQGDLDEATEWYADAAEQVTIAYQLATQHQAGDADALAGWLEWLREKSAA